LWLRKFWNLSKSASLQENQLSEIYHPSLEALNRISKHPSPAVFSAFEDYADSIIMRIRDFESCLDDKHEIGVRIPGQVEFLLSGVKKYMNHPLISFEGFVDQEQITVVQHQGQVNFMLVPRLIPHPEIPRKPIGFTTEKEQPET